MKITLNQAQIDFLKYITKNTEYENDVASFSAEVALEVADDLADELRDLCAEFEIDDIQEHSNQSLSEKGKTAYELVNLLYS